MLNVNSVTLDSVRRLLDKRQFKQALKDARVAHRQSPSDETRTLLQSCSFARAEELQRNGLVPEAKHVLDELSILQPLPVLFHKPLGELLIRLGLYEQYAAKFGFSMEAMSEEQMLSLADVAVVTGRAGSTALNEGSAAIRGALSALEADETEQAMQAVESIPRSSPFADWKLFVRGLAAYYRSDDANMKANWDRLNSSRPAHRIASRLRAVADLACGAPRTGDLDRAISTVEQTIGGEVLSHIDRVRQSLNEGDQRRFVDLLRPCLVTLGLRSPKLKDRVIELVAQKAIRSGSVDLLEQLIRATSSPAFDPRWNRSWALLYERDEDSDDELIVKHWKKYAGDASSVSSWSEAERRLAEGLVWNHLGRLHATWGRDLDLDDDDHDNDLDDDDFGYDDDPGLEKDRQCARECFTKAQTLAPDVVKVWKSSVVAAGLWNDDAAGIQALLQLLRQFPDDLESLNNVSVRLIESDRSPEAVPFLEHALRLKPLDEFLRDMLFTAHAGTARSLALKKDFSAAREQYDAAEKCCPSKVGGIVLLTRRSILERKSGNKKLADELEKQACSVDPDPNYALLQLLIESIRFKLPKSVTERYEDDWRKALSKKCSTQAAGLMAELLHSHLESRGYAGIDSHCKLVAEYLKRTSRVKFERHHLRMVCEFFLAAKSKLGPRMNSMDEVRKAATRGQKQFPDDPCFPMFLCDFEYARGPRQAKLGRMTSLLNLALRLAQQKPDLAPPGLVDKIRNRQEEVESTQSMPFFGSPFGLPPFGRSPFGGSRQSSGTPIDLDGLGMPPHIQAMFKEICRATGMSPEEVMKMAENGIMPGFEFDEGEDDDY